MAFRLFRFNVSVLLVLVFAAILGVFIQGNLPRLYVSAANIYQAAEHNEPVRVLRAVIEYNEGAFRLERLIALKMMLPASDPDPGDASGESSSGFWVELWSSEGVVLYRKILDDPILYHHEGVDPSGPKDAIRRIDQVPGSRTFSILIPDLSNGDQVVFFGSVIPNLAQPSAAPQQDIGRAREQPARRIGSVRISQEH